MFRPNRIGTPHINNAADVSSVAAIAPANTAIGALQKGNVINAVPVADFGQSALRWTGTGGTIAAFERMCLGQQFTITPPEEGDTVGVEVGGSLAVDYTTSDLIYPVFFKVTAAAGAVLAPVTASRPATGLELATSLTQAVRFAQYKTQVIVQGDNVAGTYFHGFCLQDAGAGFTISTFNAEMYVRQLNDQQQIGYRDTLR